MIKNEILIDTLYTKWYDMLHFCGSSSFDMDEFKKMVMEFTRLYRKASFVEQGDFHYKVFMDILEQDIGKGM